MTEAEATVFSDVISRVMKAALSKMELAFNEKLEALRAQLESKAMTPGPQGPAGPQGTQGEAGISGIDGRHGLDGKDGAMGLQGLPGRDGQNGHDGKDGLNGKDGAIGLQGLPGERGEKGLDGREGQIGPQGIPGPMGLPGDDGENGTDAMELDILPIVKEEHYYARGTCAQHKGGVIRAIRNTRGYDPLDWAVIWNGIDGTFAIEQDEKDPRDITVTTRATDGSIAVCRIHIPMVLYQDIYKEGVEYVRGDVVTWGGSAWHCSAERTTAAPRTSKDWRLMVKEGRAGKDAPAPTVIDPHRVSPLAGPVVRLK